MQSTSHTHRLQSGREGNFVVGRRRPPPPPQRPPKTQQPQSRSVVSSCLGGISVTFRPPICELCAETQADTAIVAHAMQPPAEASQPSSVAWQQPWCRYKDELMMARSATCCNTAATAVALPLGFTSFHFCKEFTAPHHLPVRCRFSLRAPLSSPSSSRFTRFMPASMCCSSSGIGRGMTRSGQVSSAGLAGMSRE